MSLILTGIQNRPYTLREASVTVLHEPVVERIVDNPRERTIEVHIQEVGRIKVHALSDDNYDNPEWTNALLVSALEAQLNA